MEKELMKDNNFMITNKEIMENKIPNENEINSVLSWDFSTVRPKKHTKIIQKLISIVGDYSKYVDIRKKKDSLYKEVQQLQECVGELNSQKENLSRGNQELKNEKESIRSQVEEEKSTKKNYESESQTLHLSIKELQKNIETLEVNNEELKVKNQELKGEKDSLQLKVKEEQLKKEQYETQQRTLRLDINRLLENKTFYSETLSGHKKETMKILWVNIIFSFVVLTMMGALLYFAYIFYKEGIEQIIKAHTTTQIVSLFLARGGVGVLFYFAFRFLSHILKHILSEMYNVFKGIRDIESSLILAREMTFSTEKDIPFSSDEEKRNYLSFFKLSVLKNHFINLNPLKKYLHIKEEKQKQIEEEN